MRKLGWMGVVTVVGSMACATARQPVTISDAAWERVPAPQRQQVDAQKSILDEARAQLGRDQSDAQGARYEVEKARAQVGAARAQLDTVRDSQRHARDASQRARLDQDALSAGLVLEAARAHEDAARAHVTWANRACAQDDAALALARAKLEQNKYDALEAAGDPAVTSLRSDSFSKEVANRETQLSRAQAEAARAQGAYQAADSRWSSLGEQSELQSGIGGSGQ